MKHYLIDSENVGDFWIPLLELPADQAVLIVFYTKNSPHMSYDSLIKLKESDRIVTFIKCYEGTNALDFQLCSELGFLIAKNPGDEFIIVTNDTGYDAAVKYWRRKEYSVKRIAGKDSRTGSRRRGTPARFDVAAEVSAILHKLVKVPEHEEFEAEDEQAQSQEKTGAVSDPEDYAETDPETEFDNEQEPEDDVYEEDGDEEYSAEDDEEAEDYDEDEEGIDEEPLSGGEENCEIPDPAEETEPGEEDSEEPNEEADDTADFPEDTEEAQASDPVTADTENAASETAVSEEKDSEEKASDSEDTAETESEEDGPETEPARESVPVEADVPESAGVQGVEAEAEETVEAESDRPSEKEEEFKPDPDEITAIVNCIGMDNLAELHNQLIQFYGDNGKDVYLALKSNSLNIEKKNWDKEEKFLYYCALIFRHSDEPGETLTEENISEFASFLLGAENKRKNLNSLRYALLKHYGKEKGRRYYFMLKPYVKALNQM